MIGTFDGDWEWLSNFWLCPIRVRTSEQGRVVETISTEHAYQALKTFDVPRRVEVLLAPTPNKAKWLGRKLQADGLVRSDWHVIKVGVMRQLLDQKFKDPQLAQRLLDTGDHTLIEGNYWHDTFWGACLGSRKCECGPVVKVTGRGLGENKLGQLLMDIRRELAAHAGTKEGS